MNTAWNPAQYEKFVAQRAQPFFDLVALIRSAPFTSAVDLGCGTGELTRQLFDRLRPTTLLGIDSSKEMLAQSAKWAAPGLHFELREIAKYAPPARSVDLVFSNAALHWVPEHDAFFPALLHWVAPGGQVAIQMPCNADHVSHQIARHVAERLFPSVFAAAPAVSGTLPVERYAEIMYRHGCREQICRLQVYGHPMAAGADVVEWTTGSLLTAYQERLSADDFTRFLTRYRQELLERIGDGPYFYAFKRMLLWGRMS